MRFITKMFTTILFGIFLPFSIAHAQETDDTSPLQSGSKALQFQISDNFNLDAFSGTTFSYKQQLSDVRAKRLGLSFNSRYIYSPVNDNDLENSKLNLNIGLEYTWMNYIDPESDIKFFYGYGPGINWRLDRAVIEEESSKTTRRNATYGIEGIGYVGVEWFFQSSMSLHAEYRASVQVDHRREKNTTGFNGDKQENTANTTIVRLGGNGVKFGLSVYF